MTQHPDIFAALAAPFPETKTRPQGGRQLSYITARNVMNRLDEVLGPENWWDDYPTVGEHSVMCRLTIRLPDGAILTKSDAGGMAGMADPGDDDKSGFADAFKRAAVKFGVGRYLYNDGVPRFAPPRQAGEDPVEPEHREPAPLHPAGNGHAKVRQDWPAAGHGEEARRSGGSGNGGSSIPRSGGALFAWAKEQDEKYGYNLVKFLSGWAKRAEKPDRMKDFDERTVSEAYKIACNRIVDLRKSEEFQSALEN